jgi:hypothetical protein
MASLHNKCEWKKKMEDDTFTHTKTMSPLFVMALWYTPCMILLLRDPLTRDIIRELSVRGTVVMYRGVYFLVTSGAEEVVRRRRQTRERNTPRIDLSASEDGWTVCDPVS